MIRIETHVAMHAGTTITIEALCLYVQGCRFILAINQYIEVHQ